MRLKHIAIRDVCGIRKSEFLDLGPGLNILVGDNEAGKSTVLTALRAAIFHRHGSNAQHVKDLAPYGRTARPEIDLDFEVAGIVYRLEKRFLQKAEARLTFGGSELTGEAVEDRLAQLFNFAPMKGKFSFEENQGAFGLLWVEQGRSTHGLDLGAGRDAVAASLEAEVGQILGGDRGRELVAAAKALRDRHLTGTGKVLTGSALWLAERELAEIEAGLAEKQGIRRALEQSIDRLADRRRVVANYRRDRVIETARATLAAADAAERGLDARRRDVTEAEQALAIAAAAVERAAGESARRKDLRDAVQRTAEMHRAAAGRLAEAAQAQTEMTAAGERVTAEQRTAAERHAVLGKAILSAERAGRHLDVAARLARVRDNLSASRKVAERLEKARASLLSRSIDEKGLRALNAAEAARREAAILRDAAAPALLFHPDAGQSVTMEGGAEGVVPPGRPVRITERTRFRLSGFGAVEVVPDAAAEPREALYRKAASALDELLRSAGVADLDEAARFGEGTRLAEAEAREAAIELKARAPQGLGAVEAEERQLAAELAGLSEPPAGGPADLPALRDERAAAEARLKAANLALDAWRTAEGQARAAFARAELMAQTAAADAAASARLLEDATIVASDGALAERLASAEMMRQAKAVVLAALRAEFEAADPAAIRREVERARAALAHAERDLSTVEEEVRNLEAEIRQTGGLAVGEAIDRLEAERGEAADTLARLRLEADAARLLFDTLKRAEARVRQTWYAPIRREVEPYLKLIHPGSEVALDDATLAITGLTRGGVAEEFRRLSAGAREQVAVVTRIALAQVLKRGGHPAAVILDDALVNTDEIRLKRMHEVLERAAEGLQIIVLTCRERDFRGLGAPIFRL